MFTELPDIIGPDKNHVKNYNFGVKNNYFCDKFINEFIIIKLNQYILVFLNIFSVREMKEEKNVSIV